MKFDGFQIEIIDGYLHKPRSNKIPKPTLVTQPQGIGIGLDHRSML